MGIFLNIDINTAIEPFFADLLKRKPLPAKEDLFAFVDAYKGTQISDVAICCFCQYSRTESKVFTDAPAKFHQKTENSVSVDYASHYEGDHVLREVCGIDPYEVWFERLRMCGIRPWLSVRMNDCHCPDDRACFLRSDFFYEAQKNGWMIGEKYGYYRNCFDYAVPEVRRKMLAYIREQVEKYDIYGIELDFLREVLCFDYMNNPECRQVMTAFLRDVRRTVNEIAVRKGHPIAVGLRLMRDMAQNKVYGFDTDAIVNGKLADFICISPRWKSCDSHMPVDEWVKRYPDMPIYAGLEILVNRPADECHADNETVYGYAADYLNRGAAGIYLYNYFDETCSEKRRELYRTAGSLETLPSHRRHVVTYQDLCPEGHQPFRPFPAGADGFQITIRLGIPAEKALLYLGIAEGDITKLTVKVNGKTLTHPVPAERNYAAKDTRVYAFDIPHEALDGKTELLVETNASFPVTLAYAEAET